MPRALRFPRWGAAPLLVVALVAGCGAATDGRVSVASSRRSGGPAASPTQLSGPVGWKSVSGEGLVVDVPANWPVYDLGAEPSRCVRFDVHAVYLGSAGDHPSCPARLLGRTEAVQVQPLASAPAEPASPGAITTQIHGETVTLAGASDTTHTLVATLPRVGVRLTITFRSDRALADEILVSARPSGR